jgi:hypothetical protein
MDVKNVQNPEVKEEHSQNTYQLSSRNLLLELHKHMYQVIINEVRKDNFWLSSYYYSTSSIPIEVVFFTLIGTE